MSSSAICCVLKYYILRHTRDSVKEHIWDILHFYVMRIHHDPPNRSNPSHIHSNRSQRNDPCKIQIKLPSFTHVTKCPKEKEKKRWRTYIVPAWMSTCYLHVRHDKSCFGMGGYASFPRRLTTKCFFMWKHAHWWACCNIFLWDKLTWFKVQASQILCTPSFPHSYHQPRHWMYEFKFPKCVMLKRENNTLNTNAYIKHH